MSNVERGGGPATQALERQIADLWKEVLRIPHVGLHDNFFDLGGDSLDAAQVLNRLEDAYRVRLPFSGFLQSATVEHLAALVRRVQSPSGAPSVAAARPI